MTHLRHCGIILLAIAFVLPSGVFAQVTTGTPPFSSTSGGSFDTVNLANLNVHFEIPIFSRPGRGLPFHYSLTYDSSVWYPVYSDYWSWTSVTNWGWQGESNALTGYITYSQGTKKCIEEDGSFYYASSYTNWRYYDTSGTLHPFAVAYSDCLDDYRSHSGLATDGSALRLDGEHITTRSGIAISPPVNVTSGTGSIADPNGNTLSAFPTYFTDTLDSGESHVLTIIGSPTPTSYTYPGPSGSLTATLTYGTFNIKTNLGCAGVQDATKLSVSLITSVDLPGVGTYSITYEDTPGSSGYKTGRISQIMLPTGGKITYSYGAVNCYDGSLLSLTRTVYKDSSTVEGTWNYARTTSPAATTVTAPSYNGVRAETYIEFQGAYEARRRVYSGGYDSRNPNTGLLLTIETCYSTTSTVPGFPCTTTEVNPPFGRIDRRTTYPDGKSSEVDTFLDTYELPTEVDEYDYWSGNKPSSPTRKAVTIYAANLGAIHDRASSVEIQDRGGNDVAKTSYEYDAHGNATTVTRYIDASNSLADQFTYYANGLVKTHTDAAGKITTYKYDDCNYSLLTEVDMPLGLARSQHWNCGGGVVTSTTDENSQPTTYKYGDPNRWSPTEIDYPGGAQTNYSYSSAVPWTVSTTQKIDDGGNNLTASVSLDGLGRTAQQQLTSDPQGTVTIDSVYDSMGRVWKVSNPYRSTNDPSYVFTEYGYDELGRLLSVTHPDNSVASTSYSGNAWTVTDEVEHQRRFYSDGLGRLVRVDEPGQSETEATHATGSFTINGSDQSVITGSATPGTGSVTFSGSLQSWQTQTAPATTAAGSVTINGSEQSKQVQTQTAAPGVANVTVSGGERSTQVTTQNATPGTGSVTISGYPQHKKVFDPDFGDWYYVDNLGPVSITVNGFTKSAYASSTTDTSAGVASTLASAFNSDGSSPVTASSSGSVVYLTSKATGAATNYSLSTSCSYDSSYFTSCAFSGSPSGSSLTGGQNAVIITVYDTGTASLVVNGFGKSVSYGQNSSANSVASDLANAFNADGNSPVTIGLSGTALIVTAKVAGAGTNYGFYTGYGTTSGYFSGSSFAVSPPSGALSGGRDNAYTTVYDSGTVSVTVNGYNKSAGFGQGSSASGLASTIAAAFANDGASPVTATSSGNVISFTTWQTGAGVNYSLSSGYTYDSGNFPGPSFTPSNSGGTLTGGQDAQYRTDYDSGTTAVTVNGQAGSYNWSGSSTTTSSIASGVAAAINGSSSYATATSSGATVYLTARTTGAGTNYSLSSSTSSSHNSFTSSPSGGAFTGGSDVPITYDTGTVSVTVGTSTASVSYNSGSTASSIASSLASQLSPAVVTVSVSDATVNLTSTATGSGANLPLSVSSSTNYPGYFSQPSFTVSTSGPTLTGGTDPVPTPYSLDTPARTVYSYNLLDKLTGVNQSGQTRTFGYDWLGRMTSETNPESGTVNYAYDTDRDDSPTCSGAYNGDLVKRVDAMGNVACFAYDDLHRNTSVKYPSGPYAPVTPEKHFVYDSATVNGATMVNAHGRLAEAYTGPSAGKITDLGYSYSVRGAVTDAYQMTPNSNGWYQITNSYWQNDFLKKISGIPGVPDITYTPDTAGQINTVGAASGQNPVTLTSYNAAGQLTGMTLGSDDQDAYQYDPKTGQMTHYQFNVGSQNVQGALTWNVNGSLKQLDITDGLNSADTQTCDYSYDALGRISGVDCGSVWQQTFSFDPFGNIKKSGSSSFLPFYYSSTNHLGGLPNLEYDDNGNLKNDSFQAYTWDSNGNPRTITRDGSSVTVIYDAFGRAVENQNGSSYTQIVYGPNGDKLALVNGGTLVKAFVALPGGAQAVYDSSGLQYYRHADWLGSSRFASKPDRTLHFDGAYAPYGEDYAKIGTDDLSFTGQNQDTMSGLYDFMFRRYSPVGRWVSPDPAGIAAVDLTNPQSWNRYAYVVNNPTNYIDPLGLMMYICGWVKQETAEEPAWYPVWCYSVDNPDGPTVPKIGGGKPPKTAANNAPPRVTPWQQQCANKAYERFVQSMQNVNQKYATGWKLAWLGALGAGFINDAGQKGMNIPVRIGKNNKGTLNVWNIVGAMAVYTLGSAATEEGAERRAVADQYRQDVSMCMQPVALVPAH